VLQMEDFHRICVNLRIPVSKLNNEVVNREIGVQSGRKIKYDEK
jgi:hypothetical protein